MYGYDYAPRAAEVAGAQNFQPATSATASIKKGKSRTRRTHEEHRFQRAHLVGRKTSSREKLQGRVTRRDIAVFLCVQERRKNALRAFIGLVLMRVVGMAWLDGCGAPGLMGVVDG